MIFPSGLQHFDEQFMILLNRKWANGFFDIIMPPVRDKFFFIPFYGLIALLIAIKFKWKAFILIAIVLLNFAVSDQLSSAIIKPAVGRTRPCSDPRFEDEIILRIDACGAGKSFTSSHAVNTFALAGILTLLFRKRQKFTGPVMFTWAALVSYAQIYVGVHYPIDVICGALTGILISVLIFRIIKKPVIEKYIPELYL